MKYAQRDFSPVPGADAELAREAAEMKRRRLKYGVYAAVFAALFVCAVIAVNIFVGYMTDRFVWEVDMTSEKLFEISEDTREVIADLPVDVTITVCSDETSYRDSAELLGNIYEILQRYSALGGDKIKLRYLDPNLNPQIFDRYDIGGDLARDYIIVESPLRYTYMSPVSLYSTKTDDRTGRTYYVGLRAEQALTSALVFVSSDSVDRAAYIRGHGEDYYMDQLDSLLKKMNYDVTDVILAQNDIPEDVSLVIISSPLTDYGADETDKLDAFFRRGGDAVVSMTPATSEELTNLSLLFEEWGVRYSSETVFDTYQSLSSYPMYVVPEVAVIPNVTEALNTKNYFAIVPGAMPIELTGKQTASHTVLALMRSSQYSYSKSLEEISVGFDRAGDDRSGPFDLCAISERFVTDKNLNSTRSDVLFCSAGMISDSVLSASNFLNSQFLTAVINYIREDGKGVVIPDKNFASSALTVRSWQISLIFWIIVILLPLAILAAGVTVRVRRKHL